jgi:hypothetical protein
MTINFDPPADDTPGCRRLVRSGDVVIGAIFPRGSDDCTWYWRIWLLDTATTTAHGTSPTLEAAQDAIRARWAAFLKRAALQEKTDD